ncbi:hypothetical protein L2E82_53202 [Cichorium intybus]|nr:hypothetical protein L2E82_53202 [Cichorium intybus]
MWRYPSTASFLEGLWPFRPRKFEAITARVDYVPALCTHRPSLLPIEWSGEVLGSRRRGRFAAGARRENSTEPYHLEEGEVVTRGMGLGPIAGTPSAYVCGCPIWGAMDFNPAHNKPGTNPVNHRVFERKLRPKPSGRGHACLGVTHRVAPTMHPLSGHMASGRRLVSRAYGAVGLNWSPPSVDARLVVVEKTLVLCRAS